MEAQERSVVDEGARMWDNKKQNNKLTLIIIDVMYIQNA